MNPKKKIILISIIFGAVVLILVFGGIMSSFSRIRHASSELIDIRQRLKLAQARAMNVGQIKEDYSVLEPNIKKIDKLFVDSGAPLDLIRFWEKTAIDSNLSISISPHSINVNENEVWDAIGFQIRVIGDSSDFLRFLEKIESGFYLMETQNLTVRKVTELDLNAKAYEEYKVGDVSVTLIVSVFTKWE